MTTLLVAGWLFMGVYAIYLAALTARHCPDPGDYLDAGGQLPGWSFLFAGAGIALAAFVPVGHFQLAARFGLAYNHVALALVVAALVSTLIHKRLWLAARITGCRGLAELVGRYYQSVALRIAIWLLVLLFSLPFAARLLGDIADLAVLASADAVGRPAAVWVLAFLLFLPAVIGGWRATIYAVAAQSTLAVTLLVLAAITGAVHLDWAGNLLAAPPDARDNLIPGVMHDSPGIGAGVAMPVWTTLGILSFTLAIAGMLISPAFALLVTTTAQGNPRTRAFTNVWMIAGGGVAVLMLVTPLIAAGLGLAGAGDAPGGYAALAEVMIRVEPLLAVALLLGLGLTLQLLIAFLVQAGASLFVLEVVDRYLLPDLSTPGRRLAARISVAVSFLLLAGLASLLPVTTAVLATLALPLAIQALPALLGLCWVRWISRSAVLTGVIIGSLLVVFTEPPGLIAFERLFVDLPWGRWPWTIHSAAWGLVFNLAAVLLVAIFTHGGAERLHRDRLHDRFAAWHGQDFGRPAARGAKWSLTLLWAFFAIGPGAILGNAFFSRPVFAGEAGAGALYLPSLYVWQLAFWLLGVFIVWWLAYQARLGVLDGRVAPALDLEPPLAPFESRVPGWIRTSLHRFAGTRSAD